MDNKYVILILVIILFIVFITNKQTFTQNKKESLDSTTSIPVLSNEAIQSIASVYNNQNMQVTNLNATNNTNLNTLNVKNNMNVSGTILSSGNILSNNNINASGTISGNNITINNKKIRIFDMGGYKTGTTPNYSWVSVGAGGIQIKDPSDNTYNAN